MNTSNSIGTYPEYSPNPLSVKNFGVHNSYEYKIALNRENDMMYSLNYVWLHVLRKNFINIPVVIFVYDSNVGLGTNFHKHKHTMSRMAEHNNIVYYHWMWKVYTNRLAKRKPMMFPALDFDDHIPTNLPSYFTLKWWLNIVKVAGKKLS